MERTAYFERKLHERGIEPAWVAEALTNEVAREVQPDGRVRIWGWVEAREYYFRVVTLEDGTTLHNVFPDRTFTRKRGRP